MHGRTSKVNADPTDWLLEEANPSVRYFALTELLEQSEDDPAVRSAKEEIMRIGMVPTILGKQREEAYGDGIRRFYHTKYWGLAWQLIVLAELGAAANDQIREQCEYLLTNAQAAGGGGFAMQTAVKSGGGRASEVIPCLTGNMVWSLIRLGYYGDPRLQKSIDWMISHTLLNDGEEGRPENAAQANKEACWGRHTCFMGAIKPLKALAAIPEACRTETVRDTIGQIAQYFLLHHIFKRSHDLSKTSKPGWLKFAFLLMYQTDALEILDILTGLGICDSRMEEAIELVRAKQGEDGRWRAENAANNAKLLVPFAQNEQDKWVTLRALRVLKRWGDA